MVLNSGAQRPVRFYKPPLEGFVLARSKQKAKQAMVQTEALGVNYAVPAEQMADPHRRIVMAIPLMPMEKLDDGTLVARSTDARRYPESYTANLDRQG